MAGRGPAPKDPSARARHSKAPEMRVINAEPVPQPPLPTFDTIHDGVPTRFAWPARTQEWWQMWGESPLAAEFTSTDWSELLDTAVLHARFWAGDVKMAAELRLRVAKFGATPEDRARLKITFAAASEAEERTGTRQSGSKGQYGSLRLAE